MILSPFRAYGIDFSIVRFLARNKKALVLIEKVLVLSIHLSRHNILSTYDGDHIC